MGFAKQHTESAPHHEPLTSEEAFVLGYNVEQLRTTQELSKAMFANMAGISRPTLNKIERGECNAKLSLLRRLADALNVTPTDLLTPPNGQPSPPLISKREAARRAKSRDKLTRPRPASKPQQAHR